MTRLSHEARRARRKIADAAGIPHVTWRRVSEDTGGGYSGFGPHGLACLAYVRETGERYEYGLNRSGIRTRVGHRATLAEAKAAATLLLRHSEAHLRQLEEAAT